MALRNVMGKLVRTEQNHQLVAGAADATRSDRKNRVARPGILQQKSNAVLHGADVLDIFVPSFANRRGQDFAGDARNRRLAGGVDIGNDQQIGLIESAGELLPEVLGAGVAVRLKKHKKAVELAAAGSLQRGFDFGWVVAVVVD